MATAVVDAQAILGAVTVERKGEPEPSVSSASWWGLTGLAHAYEEFAAVVYQGLEKEVDGEPSPGVAVSGDLAQGGETPLRN